MTLEKLESVIEAMLFSLGDAVPIEKIAEATGETEILIEQAVEKLEERYSYEDSGIILIRIEDSLQLCTKPSLYQYLINVVKATKKEKLTDALLETLSIIAYQQPVTRIQIDHIRGVNSAHSIDKLIEYNLIQEVGRLNAPGRPLLFGTTEEFLRSFGVKSLTDLPKLDAARENNYREEAIEEVEQQENQEEEAQTVVI